MVGCNLSKMVYQYYTTKQIEPTKNAHSPVSEGPRTMLLVTPCIIALIKPISHKPASMMKSQKPPWWNLKNLKFSTSTCIYTKDRRYLYLLLSKVIRPSHKDTVGKRRRKFVQSSSSWKGSGAKSLRNYFPCQSRSDTIIILRGVYLSDPKFRYHPSPHTMIP